MLNPSTADARADDSTIRRVVAFSRLWGYGSVRVVNLFALRTTRPRALRSTDDPVGAGNDEVIREAVSASDAVIAAWGNNGMIRNPASGRPRCEEVSDLLSRLTPEPQCLEITKMGQPRHPLYVRGDSIPRSFRQPSAAGIT
jgi:hypothetical protein